jgi:predicted amidohydrolase
MMFQIVRCVLLIAVLAPSGVIMARDRAPEAPRDPARRVVVVALQAGKSHFREGNPGPDANFECLANAARQAASSRPDLIVFPEYALMGSPYPSERIVNGLAEAVPGDGPWFRRYGELAKELKAPLVGWLVESDEGSLYNCAFVLDRQGAFVGKYRKVHANLGEQTWWGWSQGKSFEPVELEGVRYGFSICSDMWHPETVRCGELLGADVILHLSIADDMQHLVPARAFDSRVPIVLSIFQGGSYAVDASGRLLGKLDPEAPGWKAFEIEPFQPHLGRKYGGQWDVKKGGQNVRNPAAYDVLVDPKTRPAWTSVFFDDAGNAQSRSELFARFRGRYDAQDPESRAPHLVRFAAPWTSPFRVDAERPFHLVNQEGEHLFILNKTAWAYFQCENPVGVLERARSQGVNVLRVALEGTPYPEQLKLDLWPWGGTRQNPDWTSFDEAYWNQVEERVRLAGEKGIGLDLVLYMALKPETDRVGQQRLYWQEVLRRLGRYANILTWEIANEYVGNEAFQDQAATFFVEHDPFRRPVCTSDGTTDDAIWPDKPWMGLAINHTCTSSTPRHDLRDWYLALARNTRSHGKPAFANETGREVRHKNDDGIHRRKQGWLWCAAGGFWTWHSWDGCEGINNLTYRAPGEEFLLPLARTFRSLPFWRLDPSFTACTAEDPTLVQATLAASDRSLVLGYLCAPDTGREVKSSGIRLRLPAGKYSVRFIRPADGSEIERRVHDSPGLGSQTRIAAPDFTDDLAIVLERTRTGQEGVIPGTQ